MLERSPQVPEQERRMRRAFLRPLAAVALLGSLTSCAPQEHDSQSVTNDRNAPKSADYSTDAYPDFYTHIESARSYITDTASRERLDKLDKQAVADWLPANGAEAAATITSTLKKTEKDGTIPVFVSYAIPNRDLGGQSAGGLDASEYDAYTRSISNALKDSPAIMVVEPDALPHIPDSNLTTEQRDERTTLLARALDDFHANSQTAVYLDAGNSSWKTPEETAALLDEVARKTRYGIPGISLNVSNFFSDSDTKQYARDVEAAYGHKLYTLIDTSRNGDPRAAEYKSPDPWCNPPHQLLGKADALFDARAAIEEVYIKTPGESDGDCVTGISRKPAGEFDGNLLIEQLR